ncbi:MAG TPA: nitrous oxide reductase family maturation protein NosD [Vicinamibacterales bacterium]|nr:nitrous oxide reductase family maturation protein NosD [Vicinamibacterales bacterium]
MTPNRIVGWACGVGAAGLIAWGSTLPLWTMTMRAPQYPAGLTLSAYGTGMAGDVSELNILNHYIGMPPLHAPATETAVFPFAVIALVLLCLLSPLHRMLRRLAVAAVAMTPLAMLADLQWRLYEFGHSLNPEAPIRLKEFTPLVIGTTAMGNFKSLGMVSWGLACLALAAVLLWVPAVLARGRAPRRRRAGIEKAAVVAAVILVLAGASQPSAQPMALQALVDAAQPGGTLDVPAGDYAGPVRIRGPLTVVTSEGASIDGGGHGSVVVIEGAGVLFRGFTVRNSGRDVTEEAAGITITGNGHVVEGNRIEDVYFGIHAGDGDGVTIRNNVITPGEHHGARPGHGISTWHLRNSVIAGNRISHARDGIYLSFTEKVSVSGNTVTGCRYGLHSMYSMNARFEGNQAEGNLLGAALMTSDRLVFRGNRIARHRDGPAAYGVLLKDIGDLVVEDNLILSNRIGIYAESVPSNPSSEAVLTRNVIAGNEVGLALQSTAALVVTGNRIAENLTDVRPLGRQLSAGMQWSRDGRGNSWSRYRGFDANGDGIGDVPFQLDDAMDALLRRNPSIQALLYTPAHLAIEAAARMFPVYRQPPVLVDRHPLLASHAGAIR